MFASRIIFQGWKNLKIFLKELHRLCNIVAFKGTYKNSSEVLQSVHAWNDFFIGLSPIGRWFKYTSQ